ncbi:hypothetical protein GKG47_20175 [Lactonifactor sp. BIOML-A3]|uniref:hypothetical protein n=1 Tax=unclassified Lactonifactor TaxID=2636670 RepID=UPI0012B14F91|nr:MULTISPECIES: hypothetical protein [unclassified Lactonifactor]MSA03724.1 hypothetical protein [Lactonifactor sp. BIOML-A5]MSA10181.1 hypothetical protein [Lactonifactor sp. BIOML-A4]MSA14731.1 hypothetical protein [Lactonifactor sp. BIOML-A3]MSA19153.1 hypothetical protein [Lactonifactor sp. BIOML-A2]MSA39827.1 hypothetical protein [Lactonifactor sp. BIOML-A1]
MTLKQKQRYIEEYMQGVVINFEKHCERGYDENCMQDFGEYAWVLSQLSGFSNFGLVSMELTHELLKRICKAKNGGDNHV